MNLLPGTGGSFLTLRREFVCPVPDGWIQLVKGIVYGSLIDPPCSRMHGTNFLGRVVAARRTAIRTTCAFLQFPDIFVFEEYYIPS